MKVDKANAYISEHKVSPETRPCFHLTAPVGWMNDPNGFSIYQGEVHLFYQYHPYTTQWGPMHWGHAKTKDLITWEDLPTALAPDEAYDSLGCFSGSAIEKDKQHYLVYTGVNQIDENGQQVNRQQQCLAIGDGLTYEKIEANPVLSYEQLPEGFSPVHFRDPKVWEDDGSYYMVVGNLNANGRGQVVQFVSKNLYTWSYLGVLAEDDLGDYGEMWECPDFFELGNTHFLICSPQFMRAKELEFHNGHNSIYFAGTYDKDTQQFDKGVGKSLDYGLDFYAPQTVLLPDGRRVLIGWMKSWDSVSSHDALDWQGMMTLPRELTWDDGRLLQRPIAELDRYRGDFEGGRYRISTDQNLPRFAGRIMDLTLEISGTDFSRLSIDLACDDDYYTRFTYCPEELLIELDRTYSGLRLDQNCIRKMSVNHRDTLTLRFIMDTHSIELFVNDGEQVMSMELETPLSADGFRLSATGVAIVDIKKYKLNFS